MALVALDFGHGPNTAGKRTPYIPELGRQIREYEFNMPTTLMIKEELERSGVKVIVVSDVGVDTPLKTRTDRANAAGADLFVSMHFDALGNVWNKADGVSIRIQPGDLNRKSGDAARKVAQFRAKTTNQRFRGIVEQNLHVTRETKMPAMLIENGFMDYKPEALLMINKDFQRKVAIEIAKGICAYTGDKYKAGSGSTKPSAPAPKPKPEPTKPSEPAKDSGIPVSGYIKIGGTKTGKAIVCDKPSVNSKDLGLVSNGDIVPIAGSVPGWWEVIYKGKRAYVNAKFGSLTTQKASAPAPKPVAPTKVSGIKTIGNLKIVDVNSAAIVMDKPDRKGAKELGTIAKNKIVPLAGSVRGKNNPKGYWEIVYKGRRAYISAQFGKQV